MLARIRSRAARRSREAAATEIAKLTRSVNLLWPGRPVSLKVRLNLRIYDRISRRASYVNVICGVIIGFWWPAPIVIFLDKRRGSVRDASVKFYDSTQAVIRTSDNPGEMVEQLLRAGWAYGSFLTFCAILSISPIVISFRVSRGYPGIRIPGRKAVLLRHRSSIVFACASTVISIADSLGKTGERRVSQLHEVTGHLTRVRKQLRSLPRLEAGPREGRRRRRRAVRKHVRAVSAVLEGMVDRVGVASDQELRDSGEILLRICQRLADRRYSALLDADQISDVPVPDRDPIRLAVGAIMALVLSGLFVAALNLLGVSDGLEPVAIGVSVIVSSVLVFRGRAVEKLEALGVLGGDSGRIQQ